MALEEITVCLNMYIPYIHMRLVYSVYIAAHVSLCLHL